MTDSDALRICKQALAAIVEGSYSASAARHCAIGALRQVTAGTAGQEVGGSTPPGASTVAGVRSPEGEWGVDPAASPGNREVVSRKSAHYPTRPAARLDGGPAHGVHHAPPGTELVVCTDCRFIWDASQTVHDDDGRIGYECPRCVLRQFVDAREQVIKDHVVSEGRKLADRMRDHLHKLQAACLAAVLVLKDDVSPHILVKSQLTARKLLRVALDEAGFVDKDPTT